MSFEAWISLALLIIAAIDIGLGVLYFWGSYKISRMDKRDEAREARITSLESNLEQKAEQAVDQKISGVILQLKGPVDRLAQSLETVEKRLERGEDEFDQQGQRAQSLELKLTNATADLRQWAMTQFATREEVHALYSDVKGVQIALAAVQARAGAAVQTRSGRNG